MWKWLKLALEVLARLLKWQQDSQVKKAVLHDLHQESQERKERAEEITQEALDTELFDLDERMRRYRRD